ncbi:uncharacterized protein PGTG_05741 [Puccinia graminis f. sp. tritici CRL 75-36-700-3]|uniref:Uncharacterized protein n=1 Tax=Puccinia graminis f. sp. tritici (strain CRL 75-36-700-3 / race SCCL) TaxID=418459 RepID=E3K4J3_PUCGT|nr:uncharacterized protein PGTG_05741 [Puccinia graminis f. sp. tritici CRL 75-36-700-3]EFP79420.2 hypothetical protein PGTG_05741 [Puccinia graminis f. sp. tritici CRL 75-36-700-3]
MLLNYGHNISTPLTSQFTIPPPEPHIPQSFTKAVFRAIEKIKVDTCSLSAATNGAKVAAWMQAILVEGSNLFNGTVTSNLDGFIKGTDDSEGRYEFVYMVLKLCVIVVLEGKSDGTTSNNYAQMMTELQGSTRQARTPPPKL